PHPRRRAAVPVAPPRPAHRPSGLRPAPPAGRPDDRPDRPHLPARRPLVRPRLEIQPPARLRPRAAAGRHGPQRIPPAGVALHPRPAPLAPLPAGRGLRLRTCLRRCPLPLLPRHRRHPQRWPGHPRLALRPGPRPRLGRPVRRRLHALPRGWPRIRTRATGACRMRSFLRPRRRAGAADAESRRTHSLLPPRGGPGPPPPDPAGPRPPPREGGRAGAGAAGADQMTLLSTLHRSGHLRTLDHALAESLRRLDPDTPDAVLAAAALA